MVAVKNYFLVAKNKIGTTYHKKVFYNGQLVIIEMVHGFGMARTELDIHSLRQVLKNLHVNVYNNKEEFWKKIKNNTIGDTDGR